MTLIEKVVKILVNYWSVSFLFRLITPLTNIIF